MQKLLRKAAHMCNVNETLSDDGMHNYFMSGKILGSLIYASVCFYEFYGCEYY